MTNPGGHELVCQLPSLPERVWDALTNPAKLAKWFGENDLAPRVGHRFTIRPHGATGLDGPIAGEVLAVEAPERLVMRWRTASGDLVMTWLVEPGKGGTRLRVVQSSVLGPGGPQGATLAGAPDTYRALFDERLRAFLRAGLLGRVQPPPRPERPASLFEPVAGPEPESSPMAAFGVVPPHPGQRRAWEPRPHRGPRRQWPRGRVVGIASAVALAVILGGWAVASEPLITWGAPGPQGIEVAAGTDATGADPGGAAGPGGPTSPGGPGGSAGPGGSGAPGPAASGTPGATGEPPGPTATAGALASLTIGYEFPSTSLLGYTAQVTVTNPAGQAQRWQNAKVTLTGVNLVVSNVDASVTFDIGAGVVCFHPSPAASTVPAGGAVSFSFHVTAPVDLGTISAATLDDPSC